MVMPGRVMLTTNKQKMSAEGAVTVNPAASPFRLLRAVSTRERRVPRLAVGSPEQRFLHPSRDCLVYMEVSPVQSLHQTRRWVGSTKAAVHSRLDSLPQ